MGTMNRNWMAGVLAGVLCAAGCGQQTEEIVVIEKRVEAPAMMVLSGEAALQEVADFVALGNRDSGTPGAEKAANYLKDRLQAIGVEAEIQSFEDASPLGDAVTFRNVLGRIPGTGDQIVLLGSHMDTKVGIENFEGANDSGSSTGLLLELAKQLQADAPHPMEIRFAFFDGEECREQYAPNDGFHGSEHLAETMAADGSLERIQAMILLDMVGDRDLTLTVPRNTDPGLGALLFTSARTEGVRRYFRLSPFTIGDDHEAFLKRGVPAIDLIDFQFGSAPGLNDYWHTSADSMDKLSADSLEIVGRTVLRMVDELGRDNTGKNIQ
jgi:Peptidase family M28